MDLVYKHPTQVSISQLNAFLQAACHGLQLISHVVRQRSMRAGDRRCATSARCCQSGHEPGLQASYPGKSSASRACLQAACHDLQYRRHSKQLWQVQAGDRRCMAGACCCQGWPGPGLQAPHPGLTLVPREQAAWHSLQLFLHVARQQLMQAGNSGRALLRRQALSWSTGSCPRKGIVLFFLHDQIACGRLSCSLALLALPAAMIYASSQSLTRTDDLPAVDGCI